MRTLTLCSILVLSGCLGEREDEDAGPTASPDAAAQEAGTETDEGLQADAAPDATPDAEVPIIKLALGAECVAGAECESGRCAQPCQGYGTCVAAECQSDADCGLEGETTFCCVEGACSAIPGGLCGNRSGVQGAACGATGQTGCAEGLACLDGCLPNSYCSVPCEEDDECRALDPKWACYRTPAGTRQCVDDPDLAVACANSGQCGADGVCAPYISYDGQGLVNLCLPPQGARSNARSCQQGDECRSGYCIEGYCAEGCQEDADCVCAGDDCPPQTCAEVSFNLGPDNSQPVLMCLVGMPCESGADCPEEDWECALRERGSGVAKICVEHDRVAHEAGGDCGNHGACASLVCVEEACVALCTADEHCAEGQTCQESMVEVGALGQVPVTLCR